MTGKDFYNIVMNLLFPRRCPICDDAVKPLGNLICEECKNNIRYIGDSTCLKCGKELQNNKDEYCYDCKVRTHQYDRGMALYDYHAIAHSLFRFKYRGRREYADFYGKELAQHLGERIKALRPDGLVPVPIHKSKEKTRGYNQATLLARAISEIIQIPVYDKFVKRSRKTAVQKELDLHERQNNLKKAFKISQYDVKLDTIVIIDDIYTTGSTIDSLTLELKTVGVRKVYFIALAIGQGL